MKILAVTILLILFRPGIADKPNSFDYCIRQWAYNIPRERACVNQEVTAEEKIKKNHVRWSVLSNCRASYPENFLLQESCIEQQRGFQ